MSYPKSTARVAPACQLVVVQDHLQCCPYLPHQTARMPLQLPVESATGATTDWLLAAGYRRSGHFVYTTRCPMCTQCRPTRVDPKKFIWRSSFRRVFNRGERELETRWQRPVVDQSRVDLFNLHRRLRNLTQEEQVVDHQSYAAFLVDSCCETMELSMWAGDRLIGVSIVDFGAESLSAVYTFFDPESSRYSPGTYAILKQIDWAVRNDYQWVYLGMYVEDNSHLNYKARFAPQQRRLAGNWTWCE